MLTIARNFSRARALAESCALAYQPAIYDPHVTVIDDAIYDTRVLVLRFADRIEIAFRGTQDLKNWVLNLNAFKRSLGRFGAVHAGFLRGAESLLPALLQELLPAGADKSVLPPFYLTGHSLGGALASLAALALAREQFPVAGVYTFASPRVGDAVWRDTYNAALGNRSYRVIAPGDLVPLLPTVLDGYRHVGQEMVLGDDIRMEPPHWWELFCDSLVCIRALEQLDFACLTRCHSLTEDYLPRLRDEPNEPTVSAPLATNHS